MPTYVYKILKTGKKFEVEQRITEAAWSKHPETGEPVERVIQAAGIVFKGSGFYKTDSRPSEKSKGKTAKKTDSDSSGAGSSDSSEADSSRVDSGTASSASSDSSSSSSDGSKSGGSDLSKSNSGAPVTKSKD
jgi:predicted nucleic acid-binding Zn ribbon protein